MPVRIPLMSSSNVETKATGGKTNICRFMNAVLMGERRDAFKKLGLAAILLVIALGRATLAAAETCPSSPNYTDFSSNRDCLALNGNASLPPESTLLQITPGTPDQAGSAWYSTP